MMSAKSGLSTSIGYFPSWVDFSQGWCSVYAALSLFLGSISMSLLRRSFAWTERFSPLKSYLPFRISSWSWSMVYALKGTVPTSMTKRQMPALHRSVLNPRYPLPFMISGAMYAGVPH